MSEKVRGLSSFAAGSVTLASSGPMDILLPDGSRGCPYFSATSVVLIHHNSLSSRAHITCDLAVFTFSTFYTG